LFFFEGHLLAHDQLLTQSAASAVDSRVAAWTGELLLGRTQGLTVGGQLSEMYCASCEVQTEFICVT
jgi:hypothetical protein